MSLGQNILLARLVIGHPAGGLLSRSGQKDYFRTDTPKGEAMSDSKEPIVFINWQEIRRRSSRLGWVLITGLYYLAILALIFEAFHIAIYAANLPAASGWSRIHVVSLVGLELAAVWFLTLIRRQRGAGEWSPLLTLFVLSMVSYLAFRSSEPAAVTQARAAPDVRRGSEVRHPLVAKPAVLKKR
jgi:hypothetical protein